MKIAYFDGSFTFDDPNLRWGNPAYLLEPGDPGYTPPIQSNNATTTKKKKMKHNNYYPMRQGDQVTWLGNFTGKLPPLTATLGLTAGQVTAIVADCNWIIYVQQSWLPATRTWALSGTDALNEAQTGTGSSVQVLPVFIPPALPAGVVAVNAGALTRLFTLIQTIKDSGKCSDTNASLLGITGSVQGGPDPRDDTLFHDLNLTVHSNHSHAYETHMGLINEKNPPYVASLFAQAVAFYVAADYQLPPGAKV